ncbi:hypothetical protein LPH50_05915 [Xylella taiwanensis]|uniref:Transposase n=1 Tax=Xylella taiwanensis TaxID=1444770 RepID=A0ABS8TTE3_9GAMM|nr:hypothetical protein [Xylella taiwanensis]MCD8455507.1 hypothetical protein [Xylella taiwanensis]MCD8457914.1 hypothetical protein [Xylella taiwanensis]MCD8460049.1 hypothetical protein [Xylella taiwanensis]MCD8463891.1 hypothetical protein [Xylella taiwanensis]MCD8464554.1 hypothetical protein [Xylella taiwanensis]
MQRPTFDMLETWQNHLIGQALRGIKHCGIPQHHRHNRLGNHHIQSKELEEIIT